MPKFFDPLMNTRRNEISAFDTSQRLTDKQGYVEAVIAAEDGRIIPVMVNDKERLVFPVPSKN